MKQHFLVYAIICITMMLQIGCGEVLPGTSPALTTETISTPSTLAGPASGDVNEALTYTTGGSSSSLGHDIQYRFNWGDGSYSEWSLSSSASHSWSSSGKYMIQAQARSSANPNIVSDWSGGKSVTIAVPLSSVTYTEIRNSMEPMTDAQFKAYVRSLEGKKIRWTGYVEDVKETSATDYKLLVDMDSPSVWLSVYDVSFEVPNSVALSLKKDQQVEFEGIISSISNVLGVHVEVSLKQAKVIGY